MIIGWIGAGIMGSPMIQHLIKKGHEVHIYARNPKKVKKVIEAGACLENTIEDLTRISDVVCTMVGFPQDVREVYEVIFSVIEKGKICIDFTTSSPDLAKELYVKGLEKGVFVLDAPVTGGDIGAEKGTLTVLVGGDELIFNQVYSIFEAFGKDIYYCGKAGNGQTVKIANQIMIANTLQGICEAISYLRASGVKDTLLLTCLKNGAAGSKQLELNGQKMLNQDMDPGFYVKHFIKDLRIALENKGVSLKGVEMVIREYLSLVDQGYSEKGTQCLIEYFK